MNLKPCPECKSENVGADSWLNTALILMQFIRCFTCGHPGPDAHTEEEAIALWNK